MLDNLLSNENCLADLPLTMLFISEEGNLLYQNRSWPLTKEEDNLLSLPVQQTDAELFDFKSEAWILKLQQAKDEGEIAFFEKSHSLFCKVRKAIFKEKMGFWVVFIEAAMMKEAISSVQAEGIQSAKLKEMSEMAAGIAHEINNPLTVIYAKTHFLKEFAGKNAQINTEMLMGHLDKIHQHSERIFKIVSGMRSFSRDARRDPQQPTKIEKLVLESTALLNARMQVLGVEVICSGNMSEISVKCWPSMLMQVFVNIIKNAIDSIQSLPFPQIFIEIEEANENVRICIRDSGPGVPVDIENKIFSPFFTTKPVGEGTGIGLSICLKIIKDHSGRLYLDRSKSDSCFVIELPIVKEVVHLKNA